MPDPKSPTGRLTVHEPEMHVLPPLEPGVRAETGEVALFDLDFSPIENRILAQMRQGEELCIADLDRMIERVGHPPDILIIDIGAPPMRSNGLMGAMALGALSAIHGSASLASAAAAPMRNITPPMTKAHQAISRHVHTARIKSRRTKLVRSAYSHTRKVKGGLYKGSPRAKRATRLGGNHAAY